MKIIIHTPDFKAGQRLLDFINEKVTKLNRFLEEIDDATVSLKLDNSDTGENKVCEIRLSIPGNDLFASRQCKTFEEATARAVDALRSQIAARKSG